MAIKCYEFFECKKHGCIMFEEGEGRNCWDVESALTSCTNRVEKLIKMKGKMFFCKNCLFYDHFH